MTSKPCIVLGAPVQEGAGRLGCDMGPSAFRTAGLLTELRNLGYSVEDRGNITPGPLRELRHPNSAIKALPETVAWIEAIAEAAYRASGEGMPDFHWRRSQPFGRFDDRPCPPRRRGRP
jgi:arginase